MPAIFFGHGNPMHAISRNAYTEAWAIIGRSIPKPRAVLAVSAHWYIANTAVTINVNPPTIHDFGGFPKELYQVQYPAPGSPELDDHPRGCSGKSQRTSKLQQGGRMKPIVKYIEHKPAEHTDHGIAWIAHAWPSSSGKTIYLNDKALKRSSGNDCNHFGDSIEKIDALYRAFKSRL